MVNNLEDGRKLSADKAVKKRSGQVAKEREQLEKRVDRSIAGTAFPVPTPSNPLAVFDNEQGKLEARLKLDQEKLEAQQGDLTNTISMELDPRKRKLAELRNRMDKARLENQKEVIEEHKRVADKGAKKRVKLDEWKKREDAKAAELKALGIPLEKQYLLETAEKAQQRVAREKHKEETSMAAGSVVYKEDVMYRSYNKRLANLPTAAGPGKDRETKAQDVADAADFGGSGRVSSTAIDRMVQELKEREEKLKKFRRRREHLEDADVTSINMRNEKFNKSIGRAFDKYTTDIKQNLERGTAL